MEVGGRVEKGGSSSDRAWLQWRSEERGAAIAAGGATFFLFFIVTPY